MKLYQDKEWLFEQYIILRKSSRQIAKECVVCKTTILNWLKKFNILRRTISEATKGKKLTKDHKKKLSEVNKGKKFTNEHRKKISQTRIEKELSKEENNPKWKGNEVGYAALHTWIRKNKTKTRVCTICNERVDRIECCSIDHTYTRNLDDWICLCPSCHGTFDKCRRGVF